MRTRYAFSRKIATGMNIFFAFENIYQICLFDIKLIRAGVAVQGPLVKSIWHAICKLLRVLIVKLQIAILNFFCVCWYGSFLFLKYPKLPPCNTRGISKRLFLTPFLHHSEVQTNHKQRLPGRNPKHRNGLKTLVLVVKVHYIYCKISFVCKI